jgi:hypothetical protein
MAEKLLQYYKYVSETVGIEGKTKLAKATKIPSTEAAHIPDSPEHIDLFMRAVEQLTGKKPPVF